MPPFDVRSLPFLTREMLDFQGGKSMSLDVLLIAHSTNPIEVRGYTRDGYFTHRIVPLGLGNVETFTLRVTNIPVAVSVAPASTSTQNTHAAVSVYLSVEGNRMVMLCQGTINVMQSVSWPHQQPTQNVQLYGQVVAIDSPPSGANTEVGITVPNNQVWDVLGVLLVFEANATVGDRTIKINFSAADGPTIIRTAPATIQASETHTIHILPGGTSAVILANDSQEIGIPQKVILPSGSQINTETTGLTAGDQYTQAKVLVRRIYQPKEND